MIMEILTGNGGGGGGGGGGFCPICKIYWGILSSSTKRSGGGGILSGEDFVLHSLNYAQE